MFRYLNIPFLIFLLVFAGDYLAAAQKSGGGKDADEVYTVGGDVKAPKVTHYVEPEPSAQENYVEGIVRLSAVVNLDGAPSDLQVVKGLNEDEDKLAVAALRQWRFTPGTKSGHAVRVRINVEINFHLL